jgi:cellulose synthase/poly-beta-1,6-N-acetylglucosamine synthase-like glycosyltransferase
MRRYDRIDFVNTATCGFRRELLLNNLFDEGFQKLEDVELSFRLAQKGSRLVYVPSATVRHSHPESLYAYLKRKFRYARVFPALYRRFPEKMLADSSTPQYRRWQLLLLGLTVPGSLVSPFVSLLFLLGSIGFSMPLIVRAFQKSIKLGVLSPFFVVTGNMAFLLGLSSGVVLPKVRNRAITSDRPG